MRIRNSWVVLQVENCQPWVSAIPAAHLCSTAIRRDIRADSFADVSCADVALCSTP